MEPEDRDQTVIDWPADLPGPLLPPRHSPIHVVRIGPWMVPVGAAAWALSITAHAAVLAVGFWMGFGHTATPPGVQFARGDGGTGIVVSAGSQSAPPTELSAPAGRDRFEATPQIDPPPLSEESADGTDDWAAARASGITLGAGSGAGWFGAAPTSAAPRPLVTTARGSGQNGRGATGDEGVAAASTLEGAPGTPAGVEGARLPAPVYPRESRLRGEEGTVVVEVDVGADGVPTEVRVIDDAGFPRLAGAAIDAVKTARFRPATRDGTPIPSRVTIPFRFRLRATR